MDLGNNNGECALSITPVCDIKSTISWPFRDDLNLTQASRTRLNAIASGFTTLAWTLLLELKGRKPSHIWTKKFDARHVPISIFTVCETTDHNICNGGIFSLSRITLRIIEVGTGIWALAKESGIFVRTGTESNPFFLSMLGRPDHMLLITSESQMSRKLEKLTYWPRNPQESHIDSWSQ